MKFKIKKTCSHEYVYRDDGHGMVIGATTEARIVFQDTLTCRNCGKERKGKKYIMSGSYEKVMFSSFFKYGSWPRDPNTNKRLNVVLV